MGKDCTSNDPQHYYDVIHFEHPESDQMILKYQKMLKKQKNEEIFNEHQKSKNNVTTASEFGAFLTDEEMAQFGPYIFFVHFFVFNFLK